MSDLTPTFDTLEFCDELVDRQSGHVCHREQQPGCTSTQGGIAWRSFLGLSSTLSNWADAIHDRFRQHESKMVPFCAFRAPRILVRPCRNVRHILRETSRVRYTNQLQAPALGQHVGSTVEREESHKKEVITHSLCHMAWNNQKVRD